MSTIVSDLEIFGIIKEERRYQDEKWGGNDNDEKNSLTQWFTWIKNYAENGIRLSENSSDDLQVPPNIEALHELRKIIALGFACAKQNGLPKR